MGSTNGCRRARGRWRQGMHGGGRANTGEHARAAAAVVAALVAAHGTATSAVQPDSSPSG